MILSGSDEGLWLLIAVDDETVDGGPKIDDAHEDATLLGLVFGTDHRDADNVNRMHLHQNGRRAA
jgi:hypothetical protein